MGSIHSEFGQGEMNKQLNADKLLEDIGLDREEIAWRKDFIDFDREDAQRLEKYESVFEEEGEQVAEMFYENLQEHEETMEVIGRSPKGIEQLKRTQKAYLRSLAGGDYGEDYFQNRARIGKLHDMLDMPMKQYIGQYGVYYNLLIPMFIEQMQSQVSEEIADIASAESSSVTPADIEERVNTVIEEGVTDLHSVLKIINLDMQVVADTYINSYTEELSTMLEEQEETAQVVGQSVQELSKASDEVAESASEISALANEQSESVSEVSGEVANLSATVEEVASSATQVEQQSEQAGDLAEDGMEKAEKAATKMDELDGARVVIENRVEQLESKVEDINDVIDLINDIADQTNLLALNANIEAARAGDSGNGFAVVADEIKSLAEETQEHADEVEEMIDEVQSATDETTSTLETIETGIGDGADAVQSTEDMLSDIVDAVDETIAGVSQIAEAMDEQAASSEEIAAMVDEVQQKSTEVASEVETIAASAEQQAASVSEIEESVTTYQRE